MKAVTEAPLKFANVPCGIKERILKCSLKWWVNAQQVKANLSLTLFHRFDI